MVTSMASLDGLVSMEERLRLAHAVRAVARETAEARDAYVYSSAYPPAQGPLAQPSQPSVGDREMYHHLLSQQGSPRGGGSTARVRSFDSDGASAASTSGRPAGTVHSRAVSKVAAAAHTVLSAPACLSFFCLSVCS